jgi:hypothetical protein
MGKYKGITRFSGSFDDVTLCKDGTARMKSSLTGKKWQTAPEFALSRRAAHVFAAASTTANSIYRFIPERMRKFARRHGHNYLASAIRQAIGKVPPERVTFELALPALHQLDLSAGQGIAGKVRIRTLGNPVQPKGIHITGLREAAAVLRQEWARQQTQSAQQETKGSKPRKNSHQHPHATPPPGALQFRIHFAIMDFHDVTWRGTEWRREGQTRRRHVPLGNWMDVDAVPDEGMAFKTENPDPTMPQMAFVGIEWQFNPGARTPHKDHDLQSFSLLKVAALFRPESDLHLPIPGYMVQQGTRRYHPLQRPGQSRRRVLSPALKCRLAFPILGEDYYGIPGTSWIGYAPELLIPAKRRRNPDRDQHRAVSSKVDMESHGRNSRKQIGTNAKRDPKVNAINPKDKPKVDATNAKGNPSATHHPLKSIPAAGHAKSALYPHILRSNTAPDSILTPTPPSKPPRWRWDPANGKAGNR